MSWILQTEGAATWLRDRPTRSVDLIIGSPPYALKGERYGDRKKWPLEEWVEFMTTITVEATRVARRQVVWVVNGPVRGGKYHPAAEMLIADVYRNFDGLVCCERPVIWHKNAPPNRRDWLGNDWEYCVSFFSLKADRVCNWEAIATPPKYTSGGAFRQRSANGKRRTGSDYPQTKLARPRDVWRVVVGGGMLGHKLAHENEAPFPLKLVEQFVLLCSNPGDVVADPFSGSGSTGHACILHDRDYIGIDIRPSQATLAAKRFADIKRASNDFDD